MADIAATDVTYTERAGTKVRVAGTRVLTRNVVRAQFGNGVLTYPVGGVPLTLGKLGLTTEAQSVEVHVNVPSTSGTPASQPLWVWNGSRTSPKLIGYETNAAGAGDEALLQLDNSDTIGAQDLELVVVGF
jgi:hypothetical protein